MSTKKTDQTLQKCDDLIERLQELKKALGVVNKPAARTPVNALGVGWSQDPSTGAFHHSTHGIISTFKNPEGGFDIKHGGKMIGQVGDMSQAGARIKAYVGGLGAMDTGMMNRASPQSNPNQKLGSGTGFEKSNYGPKGAGLYDQTANARRKANNIGDVAGAGPNTNVKAYSSKPGQLSAKQQATAESRKTKKLSGPVKQYTPAQIAALNEAQKLKKSMGWAEHNSIPNADEEVEKLAKANPAVAAEDLMANQLANLMQGKAMLNPSMPHAQQPPAQPTDEELFGHLVVTEEMEKAAQAQWEGNAFNSFLHEATKPISSRFASEEEEIEYWNSIKVSDKPGGGETGY